MMLIMQSNLALEFLALAAGTALILWAFHKKGDGAALGMFVGVIIFVFMSIAVIYTLYLGCMNWSTGIAFSQKEIEMVREKNQQKTSLETQKESHTSQ